MKGSTMTSARRNGFISAALAALCLSAAPAAAQTSWGIGVTRGGAIVFCDRMRSTVWRIDTDGRRTPAIEGVTCHAVATGLDGQVLGEATPVDITTTRGVGVWRLDPSGLRAWIQPPTLTPAPGVWIARDATGRSYSWTGVASGSAESAIVRLDPAGIRVVVAGGARGTTDGPGSAATFDNVAGIAAAPDGSVLVIDDGSIRRIQPGGSVVTEARDVVTDSRIGLVNAPGLWGREIGIAADDKSEAVVVDPEAGRVVHVDRAGRAVALWEPAGWAQRLTRGRWGWRPSGVAMLGRTYYVLDEWVGPVLLADIIGSPRLLQVDDRGHVTRIASVAGWTTRIAAGLFALAVLSFVGRRVRGRR